LSRAKHCNANDNYLHLFDRLRATIMLYLINKGRSYSNNRTGKSRFPSSKRGHPR